MLPKATALLLPIILVSVARSEEQSLPTYEITDIPAQRIWYDGGNTTLAFVVTAPTLGESPAISMSISEAQAPDGPIAFDEETDTLTYTPAATDSKPFTIALLAVGDGTPIVKEVVIEPVQQLLPETESFGLEPGAAIPNDAEDDKYFTYFEKIASTDKYFNESDLGGMDTRAVTITGRTIILEKDHPNQLFERIHYDPADATYSSQDIETLTIEADKVIVRNSLHLPQTNLTLSALELVFEDPDGQTTTLSTTPLIPFGNSPPPAYDHQNTNNGFLPDAQLGHKAGTLNLFAGKLTVPDNAKRFILKGGKGRSASPGQIGTANSKTISVTKSEYSSYGNVLAYKVTFSGSYDPGTKYWPNSSDFSTRSGWGSYPPSTYWGGDARSPGRPGGGGDGGNFNWTTDARDLVDASPGPAGDKAATVPGGAGALFKRGSTTYSAAYVWSGNQKLKCTKKIALVCVDHGPDGDPTNASGYPKVVSSKSGASKAGPPASSSGSTGTIADSPADQPYWVDPNALRYSLILLRDAYLDGHLDFVADELKKYLDAIQTAENADGYSSIATETREALEEVRDEMITLKARIDNNLDFFGNPAGWVPMLSFEVNYAAFNQEIDRALRVMYLNYWLGNIASTVADRVDAMKKLREQLLDRVDQDRTEYALAVKEIPNVQILAEELQTEIDRVIKKIQAIEKEVLKKAKRIAAAKKAARTLGKIAQMIPVYQPALGAAGGAVAAAADIDPNKSWEENTINVGTGAAQGFAAGKAQLKGDAAMNAMGQKGDPADDPEVRAALQQARGPLLELAQDVGSLMLNDKASDPDVQAEMQRLLADHPAFRALKKDLDKLNERKRDFAAQISELLQKITVLPIQVSRNLRAINQLNQEISAEADKLDPTTLSFLEDINARAQERLLKYHYFMSRAYAYRRLESYPDTLNMKDIFDEIVTLAGSNGAEISSEQFKDLKAVYESQISAVAEAILNEANENPSEQSISILFELPQPIVDQINDGEVARLNIADLDLFSESEENLRITGLEVTEMDLTPDPNTPAANSFSLVFKHSGLSRLQKDGQTYLFRHYSERTRNAITWKSVYQFLSGMIEQTKPSAASESLIGTLVDKDPDDILIYTRPAAHADLLISSETKSDGAKVTLNSAQVRLRYDYTNKSEFIKSIKISTAANGLMPEIKVLDPDRNQRSHGRDEFERFYNRNSEVTIEAPAQKDGLSFVRWEGANLASPTSPTQTLTLDKSYKLTPVYEIAETYELTVEGGSGSGTYELGAEVPIVASPSVGQSFLRWNGASVTAAGLPSTTVPIYGNTTITALFESSTKAQLSAEPTGTPGVMRIHVSSDFPTWTLQTSTTLETWDDTKSLTLLDGEIDTLVDIGSEPVFFQVVPREE